MDYDNKKAAYDAHFKEVTDRANIIATAISDAKAEVRVEFIRKMIEVGFSTEDILKCDFTIEEINRVKEE